MADPSRIDRLPPHSIEAEQGVLGCIMLSPECLDEAVEVFKGKSVEVFYDLRNQEIYKGIWDIREKTGAMDLITIQQKLKDNNQLENVGGLAYLSSLPDAVPSAANFRYYADIVYEKYVLRRMIQDCTDFVSRAYEHEGEVRELIDAYQQSAMTIGDSITRTTKKTIKLIMNGVVGLVQKWFESKGAHKSGIQTGIRDIDRQLTGFDPGDYILLAARPSVGKTALALKIAHNMSVLQKIPGVFFEFEMTEEAIGLRLLASECELDLRNVKDGRLHDRDFPKIVSNVGRISNSALHIEAVPGMDILEFRSALRRYVREHGVKYAVVDSLQLMKSNTKKGNGNRQVEISEISGGIKAAAMELKIPIIVLHHINREFEKEKKKRKPRLSDLRESGSLEQDADKIGLMHRMEEGEDDGDGDASPNRADAAPYVVAIEWEKNRNGPTGPTYHKFIPQCTRFEDHDSNPIAEEDVPTK